MLIITLILAVALLGFFDILYAWHWQHDQLHATIETLGGITSCLISAMLFIRSLEKLDAHLIMLAIGFAGMGLLDTAHAISRPGDAFIFLHSVASLTGGFFFASVWFSQGRHMKNLYEVQFIFFGFIALFVSIGLRALIFPDDVPRIMPLFDGRFTMAAVLINITASLLFILSVFKFYRMYLRGRDIHDLLFAYLASLFGVAAIIFPFSNPWNGMWWAWHFIRLSAFFLTLVFIFRQYLKFLEIKKSEDRELNQK